MLRVWPLSLNGCRYAFRVTGNFPYVDMWVEKFCNCNSDGILVKLVIKLIYSEVRTSPLVSKKVLSISVDIFNVSNE